MTQAEIEKRARRIGARRERHSAEGDEIREEVTKVVADARGVVPMERLAELLKMNRSSIYELYIGGSSDDDRGAAHSGAEQGKQSPQRTRGGQAKAQSRAPVSG